MSALLSGEMRDTVEINAAGAKLLERYFSRGERAKLFRSWAGAASMMLKGGNAVVSEVVLTRAVSSPCAHLRKTFPVGRCGIRSGR